MSCAKEIEEILEIKVYEMGGDEEIFTFEAWRRDFDIKEPVYTELCHEFYATYNFDEMVTDGDLMSRKVIKFRLVGFETYFRGGLRNDDHSNVNQYWSEISSENGLILSRSSAGTIRKPILRVLQKMITYAKNQNGYENVAWLIERCLKRKGVGNQRDSMIYYGQLITKIARRAHLLTGEVVNGLSAPIYYRSLDTTTLRELINSNGRLIAEDPAPGDPIVAIPRPPHHSISDLYNRMGRIEIRHGKLERMAHRQSYHYDRYARLFEYMAGHYDVPL
ncbi:hypothetical protein Tco_1187403 [Tanacetum coccineum]